MIPAEDRRSPEAAALPEDAGPLPIRSCSPVESALLAVVARLPHGILVLGDQGRVDYASPVVKTIIASRRDISLRRHALSSTDAELSAMLRLDRSPTSLRSAWTVTLRGPDPLLLVHRPAMRRRTDPIVLILHSPRTAPPIPDTLLRDLYGLTVSESHLAVALAQGDDLASAAGRLGVSIHTVRTHLKKIFAKLDLGSQSALVRLVLLGPLRSD